MAKKKDEPTEAHCNKCGQPTSHNILAKVDKPGLEKIFEHHGRATFLQNCTSFEILECCGCGNVTLRKTYTAQDGEEEVTYYPPLISRKLPLWHEKLPAEIGSLLHETYTALHADSRRLAMMGARALIDMAANDKVGDVGSFEKKLRALVEEGHTSSQNAKVLKIALEAGHAAVHRGHVAEPAEVNSVIDIVENLLEQVYVLDSVAKDLENKTPPRQRKNRDSSTKTSDNASGASETKD